MSALPTIQPTRAPRHTARVTKRDASREAWDRDVLDLPPAYYGDVLKHLHRDNEMCKARFQFLGQSISLTSVTYPTLNLTACEDDIVPAQQILAIMRSVSTAPSDIGIHYADGGYLALLLDRKALHD